jgi:preprotein translocase subunit SecE
MKLISRKDQSSDKKLQGTETSRKAAAAKPALVKPSRPKKTEIVKRPEAPKKAVKRPGETSRVWVDTARNYLREVVVELKKVIWPSRKDTLGSTAVVLVIVGLAAVFLGIVDLVLSRLVRLLVG